jgi:acrylyl-CoA reductase (NADPH)
MARALQVTRSDDGAELAFVDRDDDALGEGGTLVDVAFSSLNYKDGLALRGSPGVVRTSPLVPGIDLVGTVVDSSDGWSAGDEVVVTGAGLGETRDGGYAERMRVDGGVAVRVPERFGARRAAAIGTAGFTAALAVDALDRHGIPDGPVLVTGATGGVGSIAIALLAAAGREVVAATGSAEAHDRLRALGASEIVDRRDLAEAGRPLQRQRFAGVVDSAGSRTLVNAIAQLRYGGAAAACGLVQGDDLPGSVHPFILRGVALLGINSVETPVERRREVWARLERDLDVDVLDGLTTEIGLRDLPDAGERILAGRVDGRTVVRIGAAS